MNPIKNTLKEHPNVSLKLRLSLFYLYGELWPPKTMNLSAATLRSVLGQPKFLTLFLWIIAWSKKINFDTCYSDCREGGGLGRKEQAYFQILVKARLGQLQSISAVYQQKFPFGLNIESLGVALAQWDFSSYYPNIVMLGNSNQSLQLESLQNY